MEQRVTPFLVALLLGLSAPGGASPAAPGAVPVAPRDTLLRVSRGDRLTLRNFAGSLEVEGWERDELLLETDPSDLPAVRGWREGSAVIVGVQDPKGRRLARSLRVRVPVWMEVDLQGTRVSATVRGLQASVTVRTVEGDVQVSDVQGAVSARSVDGVVVVEGIQGIVSVTTVEEAATLRRIRGRVQAESTDGDIFLEEVEGELVEAVTVDGDITFQGNVVPLGSYRLVTHDGDVVVTLPASTGADVSVSTFDGSFRSDFQVTVGRFQGGRATSFRLGRGGAQLVMQSFDGDIWLRQGR